MRSSLSLKSSQNVVVLGATGSIGCSTLDVIRASKGAFTPFALTAHGRLEDLLKAAIEYQPKYIVASDEAAAQEFDWSKLPQQTTLLTGTAGLQEVAAHRDADIIVSAIVGRAGLEGTFAAIAAGKRVALANKETLVVAGHLATKLAAESGAEILPVDSEHSAIFQAMKAGREVDVRKVILTASGGPFRKFTRQQLTEVTADEALDHPTWKMGPKITVDSATMMNKALELIEAKWLFDLAVDQIDVVVHPQSIVHSIVEFVDGSMVAQMSPPDMRMPIQLAMTYPERTECPARQLDLTAAFSLEFEPPDYERFPALKLGKEVAERGGTCGAVLNAANEVAVQQFLEGKIRFVDIYRVCRHLLDEHPFESNPELTRLLELDAWAREESIKWITCCLRQAKDQACSNT
ncbi:1-deoxy-D-xylulose-5-phosphate reductoisomerase [Blastopirellula marina]|uniref:1-deoxy-D-xylulose 5-phosphate reductoisomerase n=1 Tax=Blastopirellula marina TaxID=124 RepID=A0A2S8G8K2_9BACT|nr:MULTISPECIES: 1-deoxy-D-xylulose-5-phosphate reductoisomerase [Pirellulaceae]PQO40785.1 1-deoxy-D-xylulose-5-phosphate reductoisomerase [Blastopirellula marina]RCS56112.1 1-deoxy-D-xylulose-5-phosphate reductoisomerase [Bremerella cremea]